MTPYAVANWPPGHLDPVHAPQVLLERIERLEAELRCARAELYRWQERQESRRVRAWVEHHARHGWPDDPGYRKRLLHVAGRR